MELIQQFKQYLLSQKSPASKATVKNYIADIQHFITWYETDRNFPFTPATITLQDWSAFKALRATTYNPQTLNRHESSVRKFFNFLVEQNLANNNPLAIELKPVKTIPDPWQLKDFTNYLHHSATAKITIKNYLLDLRHFVGWMEDSQLYNGEDNSESVLTHITPDLLQAYENVLQSKFSQASVKRKLSSLRKYCSYLSNKGFVQPMANKPATEQLMTSPIQIKKQEDRIVDEEEAASFQFLNQPIEDTLGENSIIHRKYSKNRNYSRFPPLRLLQKSLKGSNYAFDTAVITPLATLVAIAQIYNWRKHGRKLFFQAKNTKLINYASNKGQSITLISRVKLLLKYSPLQTLLHHARHTRPQWYKAYHSYAVVNYFHFAVLVILMTALGNNFYAAFFGGANKTKPVFASLPTAPPRFLSFQGKLTDSKNTPINSTTDVRFSIYKDKTASGSALLWQEVDKVNPGSDGTISLALGKNNYLGQNIFSNNPALWIGVTVENKDELYPRQQLSTVAYADGAETLQGLSPITEVGAGTKNVVLALDSSGNLPIGGNANPIFQATGGDFTLSGNNLNLNTNVGSNGNVVLHPDGSGIVDVQNALANTLGNGVHVNDTFTVFATSSAQSAAVNIDQNGLGPLLTASSSGHTAFQIGNDGSITSSGNLTIGGNVESNLVPFQTNLNLGSSVQQWNTVFAKSIIVNGVPLRQEWQDTPNAIFPLSSNKDLLIGGVATNSAKFQIAAATGDVKTAGNITLTGNSPTIGAQSNQTLVIGNTTTDAVAINPHGSTGVFITNKGSVGIGTTATLNQAALTIEKNSLGNTLFSANQLGTGDIFTASASGINKFSIASSGTTKINGGSLCVTSTGSCAGVNAGTIYASNTTLQAADLAENYISSQELEPGDIVIPDDKNNQAIKKSSNSYQQQVIGIISTKPGVTLNSDATTDATYSHLYPLALSGRVPVKVSTENGDIAEGDLLTSSSKPGVAMKATHAGPIIGKALENYSDGIKGSDKIMVFVNLSWGDPEVYLTRNGNINTQENKIISDENTQSLFADITANIQQSFAAFSATIANAQINTLFVKQQLLSPIAQIDQIHTNVISPLGSDGNISIALNQNTITVHSSSASDSAIVASIDNHGNANFSGNLTASSSAFQNSTITTLQSTDATISGILHAGKIIADQIVGLNQPATKAANYITNITNVYNATPSAQPTPSDLLTTSNAPQPTSYTNIASYSGFLSYVPSLHVDNAQVDKNFTSLGTTSLADTAITGQLSIGGNFIFSDGGINVLGGDLALQPLRQGGVSIAGGQVYIDSTGNVTIKGNETINGTLAANVIAPVPDHDLVIKLGDKQSNNETMKQSLSVHDASNNNVLNIDSLGNLIASGSATINKLKLNLVSPALAVSDTEMTASGSAGTALIKAHQTEVTIDNPLVTNKSLIYITPVGQTTLQPPFLMRQKENESFTVGVQQPSFTDTAFNWLIIN